MTQNEFVQAVVNTHMDGWKWKLVGEGVKQLRGAKYGVGYCPIDVVSQSILGYCSARSTAFSGAYIGLSEADRVEIQSAADGSLGNPVLRQRLFAAAGV